MESPFSTGERAGLEQAVEWAFTGATFEPGCGTLPDGSDPWRVSVAWRPWIEQAVGMMDGDGTMRFLPYSGSYREQPAFDMDVLTFIRHRWCEMRNAQMRREADDLRAQVRR